MQLTYDNLRTQQNQEIIVDENIEKKSELELFEDFYRIQNNQELSEEQKGFVAELFERLQG
jgi:exonuclease SbcD